MSTPNISMSAHYRLLQLMSQCGYTVRPLNVSMSLVAGTTDRYHDPDLRYSWAYIDSEGRPTNDMVVYDAGRPLASGEYDVDWVSSHVILNITPSGDITQDVTQLTANVYEGYPDDEEFADADLPVIAHHLDSEDSKAFGIGTSVEWRSFRVNVYINAKSVRELQEMTDDIKRGLRFVQIVNFDDQLILNEDGTYNANFDYDAQAKGRAPLLTHPTSIFFAPRSGSLPKTRHRSMVSAVIDDIE